MSPEPPLKDSQLPQPEVSFADINGRRLAYRLRPRVGGETTPALVFLPGYASDMDGAKALALDALAAGAGLSLLRFDYSGTGSSSGNFEEGTLERWLGEALALIDQLASGPLILIGSSMGGWIALHIAIRRPERVRALVGIAAAPDFTDWGFSSAEKQTLMQEGSVERVNPYGGHSQRTSRAFWQSGEDMRLLTGPIAVDCPVRLVHGDADTDVPVSVALQLMRQLRSADVQLKLIKSGGHRLSEPHEIDAILRAVAALVEPSL
jgi:pimeloyl-ACP methyl ester carboxylesterase